MTNNLGSDVSMAGKFLTFKLGAAEFGLEILNVHEVYGTLKVSHSPNCVHGAINLHGKVVPIVDLWSVLGLKPIKASRKTCTIVVRLAHDFSRLTYGIVVDEVCEMLRIGAEQIEPPPLDASFNTEYILGVGKVGQKAILLLDLDRVLDGAQLTAV
jgi:purine-binding chemotaxis protein CheW